MTEKFATKKSQPMGERGRFYFAPILMTLKKFFTLPTKSFRYHKGQAATEYFVIFCVVLAVTLLSSSILFPTVKDITNQFYQKTVTAMKGKEVVTAETIAIEVVIRDLNGVPIYNNDNLFVLKDGACSSSNPSIACWYAYSKVDVVYSSKAEWCKMWGICLSVATGKYPTSWRIKGAASWNKSFQLTI
jgi:hypothetical protein